MSRSKNSVADKEEAPPKVELFFQVIFGKDHDKHMFLPCAIAPAMEQWCGKEFTVKGFDGFWWPLLLSRVDGELAFTDGWVPFFRHYNLEEGSYLAFEYEEKTESFNVGVFPNPANNDMIRRRSEPEVVPQQLVDSSNAIPNVVKEAEEVADSGSEYLDEIIDSYVETTDTNS